MGLFNNTDANEEKIEKQYDKMLADDEYVVIAYKLIRDLIILTNLRLIIIDKQGVTGRKKLITSYPLGRLCRYQIENAPYFDIDNEVIIWFDGVNEPVSFTLSKGTNVFEFVKHLTTYALKK